MTERAQAFMNAVWEARNNQGADTEEKLVSSILLLAAETVKYYNGAIGRQRPDVNVKGFGDPAHYDTRLSPIARPGSQATIFGQGGLLSAGQGILEDLESGTLLGLIGAAQKAGDNYIVSEDHIVLVFEEE